MAEGGGEDLGREGRVGAVTRLPSPPGERVVVVNSGVREMEDGAGLSCDTDQSYPSLASRLHLKLQQDLLACDVQLSLFIAASCSYRQDTTLRPFPPMCIFGGEKNVDFLLSVIKKLPSLSELKKSLQEGNAGLDLDVLKLLVWVLHGGNGLMLKKLRSSEVKSVMKLASTSKHSRPTFLFEISNNVSNRWIEETSRKKTTWAFHGSRLDNFHSILHFGLQQHRNKVSLFGEGIYLSEDLGVCLTYSSRGLGWCRSSLGNSLSCVALAQVVDHPTDVARQADMVEGSEGGSVPEKYLVVRNNELLHIRYLLVYKHGAPSRSRISSTLMQNKMVLSLLAYMFLLVVIGLSNTVWVQRMLRKFGLSQI